MLLMTAPRYSDTQLQRIREIPIRDILQRHGIAIHPRRPFELQLSTGEHTVRVDEKKNCLIRTSTGDHYDAIALEAEMARCSAGEAIRELADWQGITPEVVPASVPTGENKFARWWRRIVSRDDSPAIRYLERDRRIPRDTVSYLRDQRLLGCWDLRPEKDAEVSAPALMLPWRDWDTGDVIALWARYIEERSWQRDSGTFRALGPRKRSDGGIQFWWFQPREELRRAHTIIVAEKPIDCLSLYGCDTRGRTGANAGKGIGYVSLVGVSDCRSVDLRPLYGKTFLIVMDNDTSGAGQRAAELLYRRLTLDRQDARVVDLPPLPDRNGKGTDLNDYRRHGTATDDLSKILKNAHRLTPILLPGARRSVATQTEFQHRGSEIVGFWQEEKFDKEAGSKQLVDRFAPIADLEIRGMQRVVYYGVDGKIHRQGFSLYASSTTDVQRRDDRSLREWLIDDEKLNEPTTYKKLGIVHDPRRFRQYLHLAKGMLGGDSVRCVECIGLVPIPQADSRNVRWVVQSSAEARIQDPVVCRYHGYEYPSSSKRAGREILKIMAEAFREGVLLPIFYLSCGTLLRIPLGAYPHMTARAHPTQGKGVVKRLLEVAFGWRSFAVEGSVNSPWRRCCTFGHHSFPVMIDEISRQPNDHLRADVQNFLNDAYEVHNHLRGLHEFLIAGTAFMFGQDSLPDSALQTKWIWLSLDYRKVPEKNPLALLHALQPFPMREWSTWLADRLNGGWNALEALLRWTRQLSEWYADCELRSKDRFMQSWAVVFVVRDLVREFLELDDDQGPVGGISAAEEVRLLRALLQQHMAQIQAASLESVEILRQYAAAVTSDPGRHPVYLGTHEVGINTPVVMSEMAARRHSFAVTTDRRLVEALRHDGLIGPDQTSESKRIHDPRNGTTRAVRLYMIPRALLEHHDVHFPMDMNLDAGLYD